MGQYFYEYRYNLQQSIANQIWEHIKRIIYIHHDQVELMQSWFLHLKILWTFLHFGFLLQC